MAEADKRRAVTTRVIWIVIGVFFLIMVISQVMIFLGNGIRTEVATLYTTTDSIGFRGVYVRDEKLVSYNVNGIISYTHPDGSKVAKNSVIAQVYRNRADITVRQQIEECEAQRAVLIDAESLSGADTSQLESFSRQIGEKHSELMEYLYEEDYSSASMLKNDLLDLQSKREMVKGSSVSFDEKIKEIDDRIAALNAKLVSDPYNIIITETGYFVSKVDGYESRLNTENVFDLTAQDIEEILSADMRQENPSGVIGKLVNGYTWYMAAILDTIRLGMVFEGAQVTLHIGSSNQNIKAEIVELKRLEDGRSIAIFKCDMFLADFIDSRVTQARLLLEDYTGINIPNSALRQNEEDGSIGVYIQDGIVAKFRKVRQILSTDEYTLVEDTTDESGYLSLYDNIIVEGRDLHEGRIIG